MQIVQTYQEVVDLISTNTAGFVAITLKQNAADELHQGHLNLVEHSKANYDLTVVCFWNHREFLHYMFPDYPQWEEGIGIPWDSTGCTAWCETNGVDILWIPYIGYTADHFSGFDMTSTIQIIQDLWVSEGYLIVDQEENPSGFNMMQNAQAMSVGDYLFPTKPWKLINTWKDGYIRYTVRDFALKHAIPLQYDIIEPTVCPEDGLFYSASHYKYTQANKDAINQIPVVVDATGYANIQLLQDELNKIDPGNLVVYRMDVTIGGIVGAANDLISIYFHIEDDLFDIYTIYKKGVR